MMFTHSIGELMCVYQGMKDLSDERPCWVGRITPDSGNVLSDFPVQFRRHGLETFFNLF